ncbi:MAG: hypothetical protein V4592_09085 [Bacteroidota bacterium]
MILKRCAAFMLLLSGLMTRSQYSAAQVTVSSDYEGVAAKYAVLKADAEETVAVRLKNATASNCLVVFNISKNKGLPEQKTFTIKPYASLFENIGDIKVVFISTLLYAGVTQPESGLISSTKQREKISKNNGSLLSEKISANDVQNVALVGDNAKGIEKTEVDYVGVKGTYFKRGAKDNPLIVYKFENTRKDMVAIITIKANGAVLQKRTLLPGASFQDSSTESSLNIEVNFKTNDGSNAEPTDGMIRKLKNMIRDEITIDPTNGEKLRSSMGVRG